MWVQRVRAIEGEGGGVVRGCGCVCIFPME